MIAFYIVAGLILLCSYCHLLKYDVWWIRAFDFIHTQLAFSVSVLLLIGLFTYDSSWLQTSVLVLLALTLGYHLWLIIPFTQLHTKQVLPSALTQKENMIRVMVTNVYQYNTEYNQLIEVVQKIKPDIALFVETDKTWVDALDVLGDHFPNKIAYPLDNTYGMVLYSALTITSSKVCFLVEDDIPSFEVTVKLPSGVAVDIYATHPQPPSPTENERSTERDAELLQIAKKVKERDNPTLVIGDLNDVAWSHTTRLFKRISGLLDPRIGRGLFNTFHAKIPLIRFPLDHIFSSHHFTLEKIERLPHCNSDHFPIFIELWYEPIEKSKENIKIADNEDQKEAAQKISEAQT